MDRDAHHKVQAELVLNHQFLRILNGCPCARRRASVRSDLVPWMTRSANATYCICSTLSDGDSKKRSAIALATVTRSDLYRQRIGARWLEKLQHEKDPKKLIALVNKLQETLAREPPQPARRTDAKLFTEDVKMSDNQQSGS